MSKFRNTIAAIVALCCLAANAGYFGAGTNRNATSVTYGTNAVTAIYSGSNLVWSSTPSIVYSPASDFTFTTNAGNITITGYIGAGGQVNIPPTINGFPATTVGPLAFAGNSNITGIRMFAGITDIRYGAFANSQIKSIEFPPGISGILSDPAYGSCDMCYNCGSLTNIVLPSSVTVLGRSAFGGCYALKQIVIPEACASLDEYVFLNDSALTSIYFSGNAPAIGSTVFQGAGGTVYRRADATGWPTVPDTFGGRPTAIWTSYPNPMP